jgi:hypothetical protein
MQADRFIESVEIVGLDRCDDSAEIVSGWTVDASCDKDFPSAIITGPDRLAEIAGRFVMQTEILGEAKIRQIGRGGRPAA